jgi:CheY-like chemotaxis protein
MVTKGSVLVVDDEINLCRILGAKLAKSGYDVVSVHDGLQAVEKVRESDFDVVLLDLILPKMDGLTALAQIRGMRRALPVIVMTACENAEALEQARMHGVSAYVNKPFDLDSLVTLVQCTSQERVAVADRKLPETTILFAKGQPVTVEIPNGSGARTYPSYISHKDERTLSLDTPRDESGVVRVPPRTSVRVAVAARDAHYSFVSHVISSADVPEPVLVLDKPRVIYRAQRRLHPRFAMTLPVRYARMHGDKADSKFGSGWTRDLSLGGACIVVPEEVLPGEMLKVEIRPKSAKDAVSLIAQVLRSKRDTQSAKSDHVIGCRFTTTDEKLRKLLEH